MSVADVMPPGPPKLLAKPEQLQTQQSVKKKVVRRQHPWHRFEVVI